MKTLVKKIVFTIAVLLSSPLILASWIENRFSKSELVFVGLGQFLAFFPGMIGSYLRAAYYYGTLRECSWEIHVGFGTLFTHREASLGRHVAIGAYGVIGTVTIEEDVMIASRVSFTSWKRQHIDENGTITSSPKFERITIGKQTWIGEGAIILANVGRNCIVSAGAVVSQDAPSDCLITGNPAKVIRRVAGV
jgi:acetyltransferase-like isoleucine patch superfamily enzyme